METSTFHLAQQCILRNLVRAILLVELKDHTRKLSLQRVAKLEGRPFTTALLSSSQPNDEFTRASMSRKFGVRNIGLHDAVIDGTKAGRRIPTRRGRAWDAVRSDQNVVESADRCGRIRR